MNEEIQFQAKVNKGIQGYLNLMTKDTRMEVYRGKKVTLRLIAVEEVTEKPGAIVTESKPIGSTDKPVVA